MLTVLKWYNSEALRDQSLREARSASTDWPDRLMELGHKSVMCMLGLPPSTP